MPTISSEDLLPRLERPDDVLLLDVREPDEFGQWRIPGSVNLPLGELASRIAEIPHDREVVTVCAAGVRAARAAEALVSEGIEAVVLAGGMGAWAAVYDHAQSDVGGATVVQVRRRGKGCLSYVIGQVRPLPSSIPPWTSRDTSTSPTNTAGGSPTSSTPTCTPTTSAVPARWPR